MKYHFHLFEGKFSGKKQREREDHVEGKVGSRSVWFGWILAEGRQSISVYSRDSVHMEGECIDRKGRGGNC